MEAFAKPRVLVVGGGEFGASAAVSLAQSGHYDVTVVDRAPSLPAEDAASTDINKAIRFDYTDRDYAVLAAEAVKRWKSSEWRGVYHETGILQRNLTDPHARAVFANAQSLEPGVRMLGSEEIAAVLGPGGAGAAALRQSAYWNPVGGWVHASGAVEILYAQLRALGVPLIPDAELSSLIREEGRVVGVATADGRTFRADKVILALGSWSGGHPALKDLLPRGLLVPTGQTVAAIQLSPEEMRTYADTPVNATQDGSGYYAFPPNSQGLLKFALHSGGYTVPHNTPRTVLDPSAAAYAAENGVGWIPRASLALMRQKLGEVFPALERRALAYTRMCFYSDTPDGHFVVDYAEPGVLVASGGAGHAFKFLPVMGDIVRARLEGRLSPHLAAKWSIRRKLPDEVADEDRQGWGRQPLDLGSLVTRREMGKL